MAKHLCQHSPSYCLSSMSFRARWRSDKTSVRVVCNFRSNHCESHKHCDISGIDRCVHSVNPRLVQFLSLFTSISTIDAIILLIGILQ